MRYQQNYVTQLGQNWTDIHLPLTLGSKLGKQVMKIYGSKFSRLVLLHWSSNQYSKYGASQHIVKSS